MKLRKLIIVLLFCDFFLYQCDTNGDSEGLENKISSKELPKFDSEILTKMPITLEVALSHFDSLSENYSYEARHSWPCDKSITKEATLILRAYDIDTMQYYLTLILIKKYRFQLECCEQGYELRTTPMNGNRGLDTIANPLLYEFLRSSHSFDNKGYPIDSLLVKPFEFMNSGVVIMTFLKENPSFLKYSKIKNEYELIEDLE